MCSQAELETDRRRLEMPLGKRCWAITSEQNGQKSDWEFGRLPCLVSLNVAYGKGRNWLVETGAVSCQWVRRLPENALMMRESRVQEQRSSCRWAWFLGVRSFRSSVRVSMSIMGWWRIRLGWGWDESGVRDGTKRREGANLHRADQGPTRSLWT